MDGFIFVCLIVLLSLIYVLWRQIKQQQKSRPRLDRSLDGRVLELLNGDRQAALRLLRHARKNNPGRTYLWYHEKAMQRVLEGFLLRTTASRSYSRSRKRSKILEYFHKS